MSFPCSSDQIIFVNKFKRITLILLTGFSLLFPAKESVASHAMGVDFFYQCLGGNNYSFTLIFYRDCEGISAPSSATINISSSSCGQSTSISLSQQGPPIELTSLCIGNDNSTCNGGTDPGVEQYTYSGTFTLPAQCSDWTFSWTHCCRNANITNLLDPDNEDMYIESTLDNSSGQCNDSPIFTELPVPFICDGVPYCYDHGATDADGDSLVYSLVNPLTSGGAAIGYVGGFNPTYPLSTFSGTVSFDNATGQMCFTPVGEQQAVITVLIEEYRNGVLIGTTMRDLQIIVLDCTNDPPPVQVSVPCGATYISLDILDPVLCSSIATDGSDFTLTGPGGPFTITSVVGVGCGTNTNQIQIYITPSVIMGGTYTLTITTGSDGNTLLNDCGGEMDDPTTLVFIAQPLPATIYGDNPICEGASVNLTASAGTAWLWNTGSTNQTINVSPTSTTTYSVTVFNDSCSSNASFTVNVDPAPVADFTASPNPVCVGDPITFTDNSTRCCSGFGCIFPEIYTWDFGDGGFALSLGPSNQTYTYNTVGTYTVKLTVADPACGCDNSMTLVVTVINCNSPCSLTVSSTVINATCNGGSDGSATANPSGGTSPYSYQWDTNAGNQTSQTATGLSAGNYFVTVTDASSCTDTIMVTINEPGALTAATTSTPVSCNGAADGTTSVTAFGGASPYQYAWSSGQLTSTATGLLAGAYSVTITDNNTCTVIVGVMVNEPSMILLTISSLPENCGATDGSVTVNVSGGTSPYIYLWSTGAATSTDTALVTGSYSVTVTDSASCTADSSVIVNGIGGPSLTLLTTDVSCFGDSNGTATVSPSGGTLPYTYLWSDSQNQTTATATGLPQGTYSVTVIDSSNCSTIDVVNIIEPTAISLALVSSPASCGIPDGTADVTATGGMGAYTYLWSPSGGTASLATNLSSGMQTVLVTDSAGCSLSDSIMVVNVGGPTILITDSTSESCFGANDGSATAFATGGSGPYTYSWSPMGGTDSVGTGLGAGNYTVTIEDAGGCIASDVVLITSPPDLVIVITSSSDISCAGANDGSAVVSAVGGSGGYSYLWSPSGDTVSVIIGLSAGTYVVTVTDINNCSKMDSVVISEPTSIILNLSSLPAACGASDGSAIVSALGGTGSYSYAWWPAGSTNDTASSVAAGVYTVTVTDASGCFEVDSVIVSNSGAQTATITSSSDVTCFGDSDGVATVGVSGGTMPYTYLWNSPPPQNDSATVTDLSAGNYNVTVTDAGACIAIVGVSISEPDSIQATISPDITICIGDMTTLIATASGGTAPYSFFWDNGLGVEVDTISSQNVSPSSSTTYTVIIYDANFCSGPTQSVTVNTSLPLTLSVFGVDTFCIGNSAFIFAQASGGDGTYTYLWSNGSTYDTTTVSPTQSTTYAVTVTDGCGTPPVTDSVTITVTPGLQIQPPAPVICPGESVTMLATGADLYWWVDIVTGDTLAIGDTYTASPGNFTTNYLIYAADTTGGCPTISDTVTVTVTQSLAAEFSFSPLITTIFEPTFDFTDLTMPAAITWAWDFGDSTSANIQNPSHTYSDTGSFEVKLVVWDADGCVDSITHIVIVKGVYTLFAPNTFTPNDDNINDYFLPIGLGIVGENFTMLIYNRWGDMIYRTSGIYGDYDTMAPLIGWNGIANYGNKPAQEDVYIWVIETAETSNKKHSYIGHVTLIR